jgi:hypothetical protein
MKLIPTTAKSFGHLFFSYSMVRREEVNKYTIKILLGFVASFPTSHSGSVQYVFGPPGSGSIICMDPDLDPDPDPSINKYKK